MLRLHLCQIWYNPAYYDDGFDLLEEPTINLETQNSLGNLRALEQVRSLLAEQRSQYIQYIKEKIRNIIRWCGTREAEIIVFPEYSVPLEILQEVRELAMGEGINIVAGTHRVRFTQSTQDIYTEIGIDTSNFPNGSALAVVICSSGEVLVSTKKSKSKWEPNLNVDSEIDNTHEIEFKDSKLKVCVAPCIDSLNLDTISMFWKAEIGVPDLIVCPSLSPYTEMFDNAGGIFSSQEKVFALVNSAEYGGTGYNIPEQWLPYLSGNSPLHQKLPSSVEAVFELDVDINSFFLKKGTVISKPPCSHPVIFPFAYEKNNQWLENYGKIKEEVIQLVSENDYDDAIDWIDSALSEQTIPFPDIIVEKLKDIRHRRIPLYSGDMDALKDSFELVTINDSTEDSQEFYSNRVERALETLIRVFKESDKSPSKQLVDTMSALKEIQLRLGVERAPVSSYGTPEELEQRLTSLAYSASESTVASFQNRGPRLDQLREIISQGSERVIVLTGMPGIGKTDLVKNFFIKVFTDWQPIWINVAEGSTLSRIVAQIGYSLGVKMDADSLGSSTDKVFRSNLQKIFRILFGNQRIALVIDDLRDVRSSSRDYKHLQAFIEEAVQVKQYTGSRIFLISSIAAPPLWMQQAGISRIHIRGLEEMYVKRVLEYQLRLAGMISDETVPDIPQALLDVIAGHPLTAKIAAIASESRGLQSLTEEVAMSELTTTLVNALLPQISLSSEESKVVNLISLLRLPIEVDLIKEIIDAKNLYTLAQRAVIDLDGNYFTVHPLIRKYFYDQIVPDDLKNLHKQAASYYKKIVQWDRLSNPSNLDAAFELVHHLALAGDFRELYDLRNLIYEEIYPAAKILYDQKQYDNALSIFIKLTEIRPHDFRVWAYVGRCYARKGQWNDCDESFERAIEYAELSKEPTWWLYRDWAHIHARYGHRERAQNLLTNAKNTGGSSDPSCLACQAVIYWRNNDKERAEQTFEAVLKINDKHAYTLFMYSQFLDEKGDKDYANRLRSRLEDIESEMMQPEPYDIDVEIYEDE